VLNDKVAAVEGARRSMELAAADVTELSTVVVIALAYALVIAFTVPTTRAAVGVIVAVGLAVLAIEVVLAYITLRPNKVPRPCTLAVAVGVACTMRRIAASCCGTEYAAVVSVVVRCAVALAVGTTLSAARAGSKLVALYITCFSVVAIFALTGGIRSASTVVVAHRFTVTVKFARRTVAVFTAATAVLTFKSIVAYTCSDRIAAPVATACR
jgi:hypothetical protein